MNLARDICSWYETLKSRRANFDTIHQDIIDFCIPTKSDVLIQRHIGQSKTDRIFDSTGSFGINLLSNFIQGSVFNQQSRWFVLKHRDEAINANTEAADWLHDTSIRMLLALRQSNFYAASLEMIQDWVAFGNGALMIESLMQRGVWRMRFTAPPVGSYVFSEGEAGIVDKFIRKVQIPAREAVARFPKLSDERKTLAEKDPFRQIDFLHAIFPREWKGYQERKIRGAKDMPFSSCWVDLEKKALVDEGGFEEFPGAVARWSVLAGEAYGRGPGELALPDVKTLNRADEMAMVAWGKVLDPPLKVQRGSVIGTISHKPGGQTIMTDINRIAPMFEGTKWDVHSLNREDKRKQILQVFHVNEILQLVARESPQMTAFEVNARLRLLQQILGPTFGRFESEALGPIIDRVFGLMLRQNKFAEIPEIFQESDGQLDVEYEGPLARSQRDDEILAYQAFTADVVQLAQLDPKVTTVLDPMKMAKELATIRGVQQVIRSDEEIDEILAAAAEQQAQQQQVASGMALAESVSKLGPGLKALGEANAGGMGMA